MEAFFRVCEQFGRHFPAHTEVLAALARECGAFIAWQHSELDALRTCVSFHWMSAPRLHVRVGVGSLCGCLDAFPFPDPLRQLQGFPMHRAGAGSVPWTWVDPCVRSHPFAACPPRQAKRAVRRPAGGLVGGRGGGRPLATRPTEAAPRAREPRAQWVGLPLPTVGSGWRWGCFACGGE